jgi:hypothetical protein
MRKGFTQTLTALATVLLATSAMALGPLVSNVPDVYISSADEATHLNLFRYSDALVLWDYVTPGVTTGTGSTSDTLYWTWAAKNADYATGLGTGSFLDPAADPQTQNGIHYSIAQQNGTVVSPIQPAGANIVEWTPDINAAPGLTVQSLDLAGALTFRNIRLSPPPAEDFPTTPTAMPATLPAGVLDFQEATLFVTDGVTSPQAADTALLISVDTGNDRLSGGPSWVLEKAVTDSSTWGTAPFSIYAPMAGQGIAAQVPAPGGSVTGTNNNAGSVAVNCTLATNTNWDVTHDAYYFGAWNPAGSAVIGTANPFAAGKLYRIQAQVASGNASVATNPTIYVGLNNRSVGGYGWTLVNQGAPFGPTTGTGAIAVNGYLVPAVQTDASLWLGVYDPSAPTNNGNITFSGIKISSVDLATLASVSERYAAGAVNATSFTYFGLPYSFFNAADAITPIFNHTPLSGSGPAMLSAAITGATPANCRGFATMQFANLFTPGTPGNLLVCKAMMTGTGGAGVPDVLLRIQDHGLFIQGSYWLTPNGTSGPDTTSKPFYAVVDVGPGLGSTPWDFAFYVTVDRNNVNGSVTMNSLAITEYQQPAE